MGFLSRACGAAAFVAGFACALAAAVAPSPAVAADAGLACDRTIEADLVALDQPIFLNRLGASLPGGMIYALRRDVVSDPGFPTLTAGHVQLASTHRPRPIVLRARVGDCLHITFENLLAPVPLGATGTQPPTPAPLGNGPTPIRCPGLQSADGQKELACTCPALNADLYPEQTCTRAVGVHIYGMDEMANKDGTLEDGSFVGRNPRSVVDPGGKFDYTVRAGAEGVFLLYSAGTDAATTNSGNANVFDPGGQLSAGLFGSVVVEPRSAEWYRSQVTKADLDAATFNAKDLSPSVLDCTNSSCVLDEGGGKKVQVVKAADGTLHTPDGHPVLNYAAARAVGSGGCEPVLRMVDVAYQRSGGKCQPVTGSSLETYHTDLTAAVTGPNAGAFPAEDTAPPFNPNAVAPNRHEPYREFVEHYHDVLTVTPDDNAFPNLYKADAVMGFGGEAFAINYGSGGIGSEILANRVGTGPEGGCVDCRFEEFFLSSWAVGDPAQLVGKPDGLADPSPTIRPVPYTPKTTLRTDDEVKYPDDPSNVYHSYIGDRVVFRIVHAGQLVTHLHHLHAHQWLHSRNNDESTYLDSQLISPGSTYTQEIDYNGSGNRNRTVGDAIFHCHFYPHFAAGMWGLWRNHDVFEAGTDLGKDPTKDFARALPDGELLKGTPIPAIVPLPTRPMAPMPARIKICPVDKTWNGVQLLGADDACPTADPANLSGEAAFIALADYQAERSPGYPFFLPGVAGQRAPHPPMSYPKDTASVEPGQTAHLDGGLARHVALAGEVSNDHANAWDFSKDLDRLVAVQLPDDGTPLERLAMQTFSVCEHDSVLPDGMPGKFLLNGGPPVPGAPYANPSWGSKESPNGAVPKTVPCAELAEPPPGSAPGTPDRVYKVADIQTDVVFNKLGWHYPQERLEALWQDAGPTVEHKRAAEPLFFRANSGETIEFWQTNLVPDYYELDDYQVRTPTDVIGQHIHLVKFDVTSSDGAANGYNYEAGSLSPQAVQEEIRAIRTANNCQGIAPISFQCPKAKAPPAELGPVPTGQDWLGAQTTVERWWADPVMDNNGNDRTLRTVFTHDHFGPSTHQQIGLYAGLLVEPAGSKWSIPAVPDPNGGKIATDVPMGTRPDGGPTSWAADIVTAKAQDSYREFALEFQGIALTYLADSTANPKPYPCNPPTDRLPPPTGGVSPYDCTNGGAQPNPATPSWGWPDQKTAVNPPLFAQPPPLSPPVVMVQPNLISVGNGGGIVNYRNEPLPARTQPPVGTTTHDPANAQEDLGLAWQSMIRTDPNLNLQPSGQRTLQPPEPTVTVKDFPGGFLDAGPYDPYTPLLRAYAGDKVQVRVLVGAHENPHTFTIDGVKWLMEPSAQNSGHVSAQPMGISEHFEMLFTLPPGGPGAQSDYLYEPDANADGQQDGMWGILRGYNTVQKDLPTLPNNAMQRPPAVADTCPPAAKANPVTYNVTAITAAQALPDKVLAYNSGKPGERGAITQPDAILYVLSEDLDGSGKLIEGKPIEPLILRAAAGDCIEINLTNKINPNQQDVDGQKIFNQDPPDPFTVAQQVVVKDGTVKPVPTLSYNLYPSTRAGLHAQLVDEDVTKSDGTAVGSNPDQTAAPGSIVNYEWYAGTRTVDEKGVHFTPVELGTINLLPADPIEQPLYGMAGVLVIEPQNAKWRADYGTHASATVFFTSEQTNLPQRPGSFREFVALWQSTVSRTGYPGTTSGTAQCPLLSGTIQTGINYRAEPLEYRLPCSADLSTFQSNIAVAPGGTQPPVPPVLAWDPQTPIFAASAGMPARFRFANPAGQQLLTEIYGHHWQEEPWSPDSTQIAPNPYSETMGAYFLGPAHALNIVVDSAGGSERTPGDYLYRNFIATPNNGIPDYASWGLFRVGSPASDVLVLTSYQMCPDGSPTAGSACLTGYVTATTADGGYAATVTVAGQPAAAVNTKDGSFQLALPKAPAEVTAHSSNGGEAKAALPPLAIPPAVLATATVAAVAPVPVERQQAVQRRATQFLNGVARRALTPQR
jgi:hypothetical protein